MLYHGPMSLLPSWLFSSSPGRRCSPMSSVITSSSSPFLPGSVRTAVLPGLQFGVLFHSISILLSWHKLFVNIF